MLLEALKGESCFTRTDFHLPKPKRPPRFAIDFEKFDPFLNFEKADSLFFIL